MAPYHLITFSTCTLPLQPPSKGMLRTATETLQFFSPPYSCALAQTLDSSVEWRPRQSLWGNGEGGLALQQEGQRARALVWHRPGEWGQLYRMGTSPVCVAPTPQQGGFLGERGLLARLSPLHSQAVLQVQAVHLGLLQSLQLPQLELIQLPPQLLTLLLLLQFPLEKRGKGEAG